MHPGLRACAERLARWFDDWVLALRSDLPFDDECAGYVEEKKRMMIDDLRRDSKQVPHIVQRERTRGVRQQIHRRHRTAPIRSLIAALQRNFNYDGPGRLCRMGPRQNNHHVELEKTRIAPTHAELLCEDDPFLPGNFFEVPHFHDSRNIERLMDIQFRLLREELM